MPNNLIYLHPRQIPTTKKAARTVLWDNAHHAINSILRCFTCDPDSPEFKNHLIVAAVLLEKVSCPVYRGKDGEYHKLPINTYKQWIFEGPTETPEEVASLLERLGKTVTKEEAIHIHKMIWQIADIVCSMQACILEQAFLSEFAYAIEYVIKHDGDLEPPVINSYSPFPKNYPDYHYTEGIAEEIHEYELL